MKSLILIKSFILILFISCNSKYGKRIDHVKTATEPGTEMSGTNYKNGKAIFSKYCTPCHIAPERRVEDQYMFDHLFERMPEPSESYFIKYIRDSKNLKAEGDKYAIQLSKNWNSTYNHNFNDSISLKSFEDLIIYIKVAAILKYQ